MRGIRRVWVVLFCLATALPAAAQLWSMPGPKSDLPTLCTLCKPPATGLPTWQFESPIVAHAGRFVDSTTAGNVQNKGFRTVRAYRVRTNRERDRIYVALGGALGVYKLDTFFTLDLRRPMETPWSFGCGEPKDRSPVETMTMPWQYFYVECAYSGWTYSAIDQQEVLRDFDGDDRGYVYIGSEFGWGIAQENPAYPRAQLDYVIQLQPSVVPHSVISLRLGTRYYTVLSQSTASAGKSTLFDVTTPSRPIELVTRSKTGDKQDDKYGIKAWAKDEARQRLALLNTDGHVRIYDYAAFLDDTEPLADYRPRGNRSFADLAFDEAGNLWFTETAQDVAANLLHRATLVPGGYRKDDFDVYGGSFSPRVLAAGGGFVAAGGRSALDSRSEAGDLRLFRIVNDVPVPVSDNGFFRNYYDVAPSGYVAPTIYNPPYIGLRSLQLVEQGGKVYLTYSAIGLGDVYELSRGENRIPTTLTLRTELQGSNVQIIATVTASSMGTAPMSGVVTITKNGQAFASVNLSGTNDPLVFIANVARTDLDTVATLVATYEGDAYYAPSGPVSLQFSPATLSAPAGFSAVATAATSVQLNWDALPGVDHYDVLRRSAGSDWTIIATPKMTSYVDNTVTANQAYLYRVRGVDTVAGLSSVTEIATTYAFTDDPLDAGTNVRAAHVTELRSAVNALRSLAGLGAFTFTDPALTPGMPIRAIHAAELRTACDQLHAALGLPPVPSATPFSRTDLAALRSGVR